LMNELRGVLVELQQDAARHSSETAGATTGPSSSAHGENGSSTQSDSNQSGTPDDIIDAEVKS
jgi:hypothetical protein